MYLLFLSFLSYALTILSYVPLSHWVVMGLLSLALTIFLIVRKTYTFYGAVAIGATVFWGMFLLDTAVGIRFLGFFPHWSGIKLKFDLNLLFNGTMQERIETLSNIAVFVPFGFFIAEFLASMNRYGVWRRVFLGTLASFLLSLSIEFLQFVLHVGYFESSDIVMNMVGGLFGAGLSAAGRKVLSARCWAAPSER